MPQRPVLNAVFKKELTSWKVRLERDQPRLETSWEDWHEPAEPASLLWTIFHHRRDRELLKQAHSLRLSPADLTTVLDEPIPTAAWWQLNHLSGDVHLLSEGWTVTQLTVVPQRIAFNGSVAVVGSPTLCRRLQDALGPDVALATTDDLPMNGVVVIEGEHTPAECVALRAAAKRRHCAVLVWLRTTPPPSRFIEVVPARDGKADLSEDGWLTRFLSELRGGSEPEDAFRIASLVTLTPDTWWLRGAPEPWVFAPHSPSIPVDEHWRHRIDRFVQEKMVETMLENLTRRGSHRRVQVVVTPGASKSGLTSFVSRDFDANGCGTVKLDPPWADDPNAQLSQLCARLDVEEDADLAYRLAARARPHCTNGRPAVFMVRHPPVTVGPERDGACRQIPLESLRKYVDDLRALAGHLRATDARLIVHVPIVTEGGHPALEKELAEPTTPLFAVEVLPALASHVPADQVAFWLRNQGITVTPTDNEKLATIDSYDELIRWLAERFSKELGAA